MDYQALNYNGLTKLAEENRDTPDPVKAAGLALDLALYAVGMARQAANLELARKDFLHGIRDRIMAAQSMAKTPAEEEARKTPDYLVYCERIGGLEDGAERLKQWSRYYGRVADALVASREVSSV
jgi:hypothetical protein